MKIETTRKEDIAILWIAILVAILCCDLGIIFLLLWFYIGSHVFFGPLDWYLIYKALKKLRR